MKNCRYMMFFFTIFAVTSMIAKGGNQKNILPYSDFGLTERKAAAYLLDRFAFGARPGEVDQLLEIGLETWFNRQLNVEFPNQQLNEYLSHLHSLHMSNDQILNVYPPNGVVKSMARREGIISSNDQNAESSKVRQKLKKFSVRKGFRPQRELLDELISQKILRSVYSENQLAEVLTDFWFNHFNVSSTDNQAKPWILSYERDAIRPHILGHFRDLLGATAKHPAMLYYLDNDQSSAASDATLKSLKTHRRKRKKKSKETSTNRNLTERATPNSEVMMTDSLVTPKTPQRGINENYARELMELHTLGVDGGYTQKDVVEVARAFTGWKVNRKNKRTRGKPNRGIKDGDFLFSPWNHDVKEKTILGQKFPHGGGIEEGERVLDILALHPATAKHISQKLATFFVSEDPPKGLVDRLAKVFLNTDGDIQALMREISVSPEFWQARETYKTKSPVRLIVSALRSTKAGIKKTQKLAQWAAEMGQPLYACRPPTGYPDRGAFWINAGTLLKRMNFGISLASNQISGISLDLKGLGTNSEDNDLDKSLTIYTNFLLPERDITKMLQRLDQQLISDNNRKKENKKIRNIKNRKRRKAKIAAREREQKKLIVQAIGIILGSPEFQIH